MSIASTGKSAAGKLVVLVVMAGAFLFGMAGVVYMSLQGEEIKVPEIVGKDFVDSEKELASLGLKIKRRADRFSTEKPNTVLEQLPKPGETVKTGQMILVVTSKAGGEEGELPTTLQKSTEEEDSQKIEEMISEKPKKSKANTNTAKKKADTTRDVISNTAATDSNTEKTPDSDKKQPETGDKPLEKGTKVITIPPPAKPSGSPTVNRPSGSRTPNN